MPKPKSRDEITRLPGRIDWAKAVARVRRARSDEVAIKALQRHLNTSLLLFDMVRTEELNRRIRRERGYENVRERIEAMAKAMADASESEDWRSFLAQARVLDAALHARRMFEV